MDYNVAIRTGDRSKAGTNARVYIKLLGTEGETPDIRLNHPNYNDFKRNTRDEYNFTTDDVGELRQVRLRHDDSGSGPGWFLESVLVIRGSDGRSWETKPSRWLADTVPSQGGINQTFDVTAANASFDYVSVIAKMVDGDSTEKKTFYVDPRSRSVTITLKHGATSALVEKGSEYWFLGSGTHTLPAGGEYVLSVGSYALLGGTSTRLPEAWLAYSRLKA